jgi:4-hydroxybenzoate polyprenyltransferase
MTSGTPRDYLQLIRLPAVFTAAADIFLGFLLNHASLQPWREFALLVASSACLYSSGMVWNDVFDRRVDATERPERPIPSRRVSVAAAVVLATVLMLLGVAAAGVVGWLQGGRAAGGGFQSLKIAGLLTICILAYDGLLKRTVAGPVAMGACRFLNVMLGASAHSATIAVWSRPQTLVAACLGIYVAGITWFARSEAGRSRRGGLAAAAGLVNLGLLALLGVVLTHPWRGEPNVGAVFAVLGAVILVIDCRLAAAIAAPSPGKVQTAVKSMIFSLVLLDATIVFAQTGRAVYALATAALLVPSVIISRWISAT